MTDTDRSAAARVLPLLGRAVRYEVAMWRSLYRWVTRRPLTTQPGDRAFGYAGAVTPILGVFIGVSAVEIPLLDVILRHLLPWPTLRMIMLGIGIYGLLWMIGLLASLRVHPHVVGGDGLRIRNGTSIDITLPWDAVATIGKRHRSLPSSRAIQFDNTGTAAVLNLSTGSQTSIDVVLRQPTTIRLPKGPSEPITELRFYADDSDGLVARSREHLLAHPPSSGR